MWKQLVNFNINKMGHKKGYCLQNVRLGFGLPAKYGSAKDDMEANKRVGTLHNMNTIPNNVAVPVYVDSTSKYEHIIVCDKGTYYSDGSRLTSIKGLKFFGWGEMCEGVRVVEFVPDNKKSIDEVAKEVLNGAWSNGDKRKKLLTEAGYDYNAVQNKVNELINNKQSTNYYPICNSKYGSIIDALNSIGVDSSFTNRKRIAQKNGVRNYIGTSQQNIQLLTKLKAGKLLKV